MPESAFYAKAMRGTSQLVGHWLLLGQASPDRLAMILADTARLARLGEPEDTPDGAQLDAWSRRCRPPLWAPRTALFLLAQMPSRPLPRSNDEACAWAYCWLRNRAFDELDLARAALPEHLRQPLAFSLVEAWDDLRAQRLV